MYYCMKLYTCVNKWYSVRQTTCALRNARIKRPINVIIIIIIIIISCTLEFSWRMKLFWTKKKNFTVSLLWLLWLCRLFCIMFIIHSTKKGSSRLTQTLFDITQEVFHLICSFRNYHKQILLRTIWVVILCNLT